MLETLNTDLSIIQTLSDRPNEDDDLSAEQLKAKFDESSNLIKEYINDILISVLNTDAANNLGIGAVEGFPDCTTIADALVQLYNSIIQTIEGSIPDNSLTNAKLKSRNLDGTGGIQSDKIGLGAVEGINIKNKTVGPNQLADEGVTTDKYANGSITTAKYANSSVTNDKLANNISGGKLATASIPAGKYGAKSIKNSDLDDAIIKSRNIPDNEIPLTKLYGDVQGRYIEQTVTLASGRTSWTVTVEGVTATNLVIVAPASGSEEAWSAANIKVPTQASNSLSFTASTAPSGTISVNVAIFP